MMGKFIIHLLGGALLFLILLKVAKFEFTQSIFIGFGAALLVFIGTIKRNNYSKK